MANTNKIKVKSDLQNTAKDLQKPPAAQETYTMGSTACILKNLIALMHNLSINLVTPAALSKLALAEAEIAVAMNSIESSQYPVKDNLQIIENRVMEFGQLQKTAGLQQTFGQQLPGFRSDVQKIIDDEEKLRKAIQDYGRLLSETVKELISKLLAVTDNKAQMRESLSKDLLRLLNSAELTTQKKKIETETERFNNSRRKLNDGLSALEQQTRNAANAAGIRSLSAESMRRTEKK